MDENTIDDTIIDVEDLRVDDYINTINMSQILLPNRWTMYLYDKALFKKITNRANFKAIPHKEICTINTVNDLIYIIHLMESKLDDKSGAHAKINLDANDYIFMRNGIEPIWEDPRNANGGTFTIKMNHANGFNVWLMFIMYMMGETMTYDMKSINGITVSYICDSFVPKYANSTPEAGNNSYTYIKVWDSEPDRDAKTFLDILPSDLRNKIKGESLQYSSHKQKKHYGHEDIISKISDTRKRGSNRGRGRGGFSGRGGGFNRNK